MPIFLKANCSHETTFLIGFRALKQMHQYLNCAGVYLLSCFFLFKSSILSFLCRISKWLCCVVLCFITQSCLTLCDPMDCSQAGSSVRGDSPGRNTAVRSSQPLESDPGLPHCRRTLYHLSDRQNTLHYNYHSEIYYC